MNIKTNDLCKIANDVSEKYMYSVGIWEYVYILVKYAPKTDTIAL
jgi:hypothetical protein